MLFFFPIKYCVYFSLDKTVALFLLDLRHINKENEAHHLWYPGHGTNFQRHFKKRRNSRVNDVTRKGMLGAL